MAWLGLEPPARAIGRLGRGEDAGLGGLTGTGGLTETGGLGEIIGLTEGADFRDGLEGGLGPSPVRVLGMACEAMDEVGLTAVVTLDWAWEVGIGLAAGPLGARGFGDEERFVAVTVLATGLTGSASGVDLPNEAGVEITGGLALIRADSPRAGDIWVLLVAVVTLVVWFVVAGGAGLMGAAGRVAAGAFLTERIVFFPVEEGVDPAAVPTWPVVPLDLIRARMREASTSLIELLWLLAVIESRSAASSTSLLSRPKSRDSS